MSCHDMGKARFIVYNKSNSKIDSLYFMPSNIKTRHFLSLKPGEEVWYKLSMDEQGTDGAYGIMFKQRDKQVSKVFGYFSNGVSLEKFTEVEIMDDTLLFRQKY